METITSPLDRELNSRHFDGLLILLMWRVDTLETYVTVRDDKLGDRFSVEVPSPDKCNEVFQHPFAFRVEEEVGHGTASL